MLLNRYGVKIMPILPLGEMTMAIVVSLEEQRHLQAPFAERDGSINGACR